MKQTDSKYEQIVVRKNTDKVQKEMIRQNSKYLFYYSFKIGVYGQGIKSWEILDWKIPAPDIKLALIQFKMIWHYSVMDKSQRINYKPKDTNARSGIVRQIIEFQAVKRTGKTVIQYKKLFIYNYHEFKNYV